MNALATIRYSASLTEPRFAAISHRAEWRSPGAAVWPEFRISHGRFHAAPIGVLLWSPADIEFSPHRLVQPDLFIASLNEGRRPRTWRDVRSLVLAIEALSPATAHADRHRKRRIYMEEAVDEYWIVDLDARPDNE